MGNKVTGSGRGTTDDISNCYFVILVLSSLYVFMRATAKNHSSGFNFRDGLGSIVHCCSNHREQDFGVLGLSQED